MKRPKAKPARTIGPTDLDNTPPPETMEHKVDLLIRDICQNGTDSVHNMRVVNTDDKSHSGKQPEKCLQEAEREKTRMYLKACLKQNRHFSPFVASMYGLLGVEATATLKRIASCLATKWRQPYSRTCVYDKINISNTLLRATHRCIRGSRVPAHHISVQLPQWEDGPGLNLSR